MKNGSYVGADIAPHTQATRFTYTVPTGKKAFVEMLQTRVQRSTAASAASRVIAWIGYQPSGGSGSLMSYSVINTNGVGDKDANIVGQSIVMNAGDTLTGYTSDGSTGGACDYMLNYKITEFDA
jgi:hypothetical protein